MSPERVVALGGLAVGVLILGGLLALAAVVSRRRRRAVAAALERFAAAALEGGAVAAPPGGPLPGPDDVLCTGRRGGRDVAVRVATIPLRGGAGGRRWLVEARVDVAAAQPGRRLGGPDVRPALDALRAEQGLEEIALQGPALTARRPLGDLERGLDAAVLADLVDGLVRLAEQVEEDPSKPLS